MTLAQIREKLVAFGLTPEQVRQVIELIVDIDKQAQSDAHWRDWDFGG